MVRALSPERTVRIARARHARARGGGARAPEPAHRPAPDAAAAASSTVPGSPNSYGGSSTIKSNGVPSIGRGSAPSAVSRMIAQRSRTPQSSSVFADERRRPSIVLDERHPRGPAAEALEADRARPCKHVEHTRVRHPRGNDVEQRLAQLVGCRTKPGPVGALSRRPLNCPAMIAHGLHRTPRNHPTAIRPNWRSHTATRTAAPPASARRPPRAAALR